MKENLANNVKSELLEPEIKLEIKQEQDEENELKINENQLKINENQPQIKKEPEDDYENNSTERIEIDPNASIVLNHSAICDEEFLIKKN